MCSSIESSFEIVAPFERCGIDVHIAFSWDLKFSRVKFLAIDIGDADFGRALSWFHGYSKKNIDRACHRKDFVQRIIDVLVMVIRIPDCFVFFLSERNDSPLQ